MGSVAHNKLPWIFDDNVTLSDQGRGRKFPWKPEWRFNRVHVHERSYCEKSVTKWWKQMLSILLLNQQFYIKPNLTTRANPALMLKSVAEFFERFLDWSMSWHSRRLKGLKSGKWTTCRWQVAVSEGPDCSGESLTSLVWTLFQRSLSVLASAAFEIAFRSCLISSPFLSFCFCIHQVGGLSW